MCLDTLICSGWAYECTLTLFYLCSLGVNFWKIEGVWLMNLSDVVMLWLRLHTPVDCISHPHHKKMLYHLDMLWIGIWVHPYTVMPVQLGGEFLENRVWWSLSDDVMLWLRLQTPVHCIPQPYHMHKMCLSTLICCGLEYGCTLTLLCLCKWG